MSNLALDVGQTRQFKGCFTEEYFIKGMSLSQIWKELGLPPDRIRQGAFVCFAIQRPSFHEFELGAYAKFPTDKFYYSKHKNGKKKWREDEFEETFWGMKTPLSTEAAKYQKLEAMKNEKLVKLIPAIRHKDSDVYPSGGQASQIIVKHPIQCLITHFLNKNDTYRGVWS